jgi:hypothetical protein
MKITESQLRNLIKKTLIENTLLNENNNIENITQKLSTIAAMCLTRYPKIWNQKIINKEINMMNKITDNNIQKIIKNFKDIAKTDYPFEIIFTHINKFLPFLSRNILGEEYSKIAEMVWKLFMSRHQKKIKSHQGDDVNISETGKVANPENLDKMMKNHVKLTTVKVPREKSVDDLEDIIPAKKNK